VSPKPQLDDPEVYRTLVEGIPAIVYVDEPDEISSNFYTSPQAVELLGFTQEEWSSSPDLWIDRLHPDDRDRVMEENTRSNRDQDRFFSEYRFLAKDGRWVWIRDEATLVFDEGGVPQYWRGIMLDVTAEKEAEEKLRWSLDVLRRTIQQRRELALRLEDAQENERRRIAADIHDDPIQVMSAVDLRLQTLAMHPAAISTEELDELHHTVELAIERLRSLLFELRPSALDRAGLTAGLREYLDHVAGDAGWDVQLDADLTVEPPPDLRATLFRIAQEAIANARKHASAGRVDVGVRNAAGGVLLRVHDDGRGFDTGGIDRPEPGHMGLPTTFERAELAGGWCRVTSAPGDGTALECWLPIDEPIGVADAADVSG
jgi:PAS domain S-box-containing protein